jgi:hypothetical protein
MSVVVRGGASGTLADTKPGVGGEVALVVSNEATLAEAGYQGAIGIVDPGTVVAGGIRREFDVSADFRQRVGTDTCLWQDVFQYTTINNSAYSVTTTTMTITQANGLLNLNAGSATASGNVVALRTWRTFPILSSAPTYCYFSAIGINQTALNAQADIGLGYAATTAAPTDGVFFRWALDGTLRGVLNNNGTETQTLALTQIADNERGEYLIVMNDENVEFWIDGILRATLNAVTTYTGHGVTQSTALPFVARLFNSGTASAAKRLGISEVGIAMGDLATNRLWASQMSGMELGAYQSPPGAAAAQTATWTNSAAPANATLSNTAAGYATLGGIYQFVAVAGAETDYALFGYQNPAGSVTQPGKNLMIRGVRIETFNSVVAVATTAHVFMWALGVGSSAVSLATADSLTAGTRGPRRIPLGVQFLPVAAAVGQSATAIDVNLDAPILAAPGSFVHIILRMPVATATATQVIRGVVMVNGYFE